MHLSLSTLRVIKKLVRGYTRWQKYHVVAFEFVEWFGQTKLGRRTHLPLEIFSQNLFGSLVINSFYSWPIFYLLNLLQVFSTCIFWMGDNIGRDKMNCSKNLQNAERLLTNPWKKQRNILWSYKITNYTV